MEEFVPDFYFCSDTYFLHTHWDEIAKYVKNTHAFIRWPFHAKLGYDAIPTHRIPDKWSFEPDVVVGLGGSITYIMLQYMYWMGVKTVLVVGLDHDYFKFETMPQHFDSRYVMTPENHPQLQHYRGNAKYAARYKALTQNSYLMARKVFEEDGRRIINLTPNSGWLGWENGKIDDWYVDNS